MGLLNAVTLPMRPIAVSYNTKYHYHNSIHILVEEVQKAVKKLKNNKSPGNDLSLIHISEPTRPY